MSVRETFTDYWYIVATVASAIGATVRFFVLRGTRKATTSKMLYEELERLKQKVIRQVSVEVDRENELGEKQKLINGLRLHCPECYRSYLQKYGVHETTD